MLLLMKRHIHDVGNLLSRAQRYDFRKLTQRKAPVPRNLDRRVIGGTGPDLFLEGAEPLTHRQSPPL